MTFPIVAIGASAGGLEALSELLAALPSKSGLAYIAVQHLDPDHESLLAEILTKKTSQAVMPARDGLAIELDHVYVIAPNTTLTVVDGHLRVVRRASGLHHPADILFTSLAKERADCAFGVVLSGGDGDGALGIQAIKEAGGITFAQEPSSAKFPSMPKHAIETGCVDFVLRPKQIAQELMRLSRHPYLRAIPASTPPPGEPGQGTGATEEESLKRIFRRLRSAHGVDFAHYKRSTLRRRLERRMALQKTENRRPRRWPTTLRSSTPTPSKPPRCTRISSFESPRSFAIPNPLRGSRSGSFRACVRAERPRRPSGSGFPDAPAARRSTQSP